ncbi:hypothetical protein ACFV2L_42615, partial [Streptomyces sp. NPDC059687]|uniref:hypothetical protein n=1 Tax=Streptomyces sp. NPDC059687 TaxID=3346905 RepID=UPI00368F1D50
AGTMRGRLPLSAFAAMTWACFCYRSIDLDQDGAATELRLGALDSGRGGQVRQKAYAHSTCLRERVHPSIDLWWEL